MAVYGLDLRRCLWGPDLIGVRRLRVLVEQLPPESATARSKHRGWTVREELAALTVEYLDTVVRAVRAGAGDKDAVRQKPLQIPRPQVGPKKSLGWAGLARRLMGGG